MKISSASEILSFTPHQLPEVLWRGRTMAILGAVAGVCLLYLFRARLSQCLFGAQQNSPEVLNYKSFEVELISFQQFIEIHADQLSEWCKAEGSSSDWLSRLKFCKTLMFDVIRQIERICREGSKDTDWDECKNQLVRLGSSDKGKEVCGELKKCLETLARINKQRMELIVKELSICYPRPFASYQEYVDYLCKDTGCANPSESSAVTRQEGKKEAFNKLSKIAISAEIIPQIYVKFFDHTFRKLRLYVCGDLVEKIKRVEEIDTKLDLRYQIITPFLAKIDQLSQGSEGVLAKKLDQMRLGLLKLLGPPKFSIDFITQLKQFETAKQISELERYTGLNLRSQILEPLVAAIDQLAQGPDAVVAGELGQHVILSLLDNQQFVIDIIRRLEDLDQERQSFQLEIYSKLDLLYQIVRPFEAEIEELAQGSEEPVARKLGQMKKRLFSLLGDPECSMDIIKELEELDKERQILQLESYAKKQGLLA